MDIDEVYKILESKHAESIKLGYIFKSNATFNQGRADALLYAINLLTPFSKYALEKENRWKEHVKKALQQLGLSE